MATGVAANAVYYVYDWGTDIDRVTVAPGQMNVELYDIYLSGATYTLYVDANTSVTAYQCKLGEGNVYIAQGGAAFWDCFFTNWGAVAYTVMATDSAAVTINRSKVFNHSHTGYTILCLGGATVVLYYGCVLEGMAGASAGKADHGVRVYQNGVVNFLQAAGMRYHCIRNCDNGITAQSGGQAFNTTLNQFSNNGTDKNPTPASYGYID